MDTIVGRIDFGYRNFLFLRSFQIYRILSHHVPSKYNCLIFASIQLDIEKKSEQKLRLIKFAFFLVGNQENRENNKLGKRNRIYIPTSPNNNVDKDYNPKQININKIPNFPTKSGLTEKDAIDICTKSIKQSSFGKACLNMYPDIDFSVVVEECVTDTKVCHILDVSRHPSYYELSNDLLYR